MSETVVRAFEMPLARADAPTWAVVRECWKNARALANWCVDEMRRQDDPELPKPPEFDLYARAFGREKDGAGRKDKAKVLPARRAGFAGHEFFAGCKLAGASIISDVQGDYRRDRFEVLVRRGRAFRSYREYPWPVHGQLVKDAWIDGNGRPWLSLTLPGGRAELQMRNGRDFAPQMARFRDLIARKGQGLPFKEIVLREKRCRGGDVLVKMVAELPVREKTGDRPLVLTLSPSHFWTADFIREGPGERCFVRAWVLNNDHWRGVAARHRKHLDLLARMRQDAKAERRMGNNRAKQQALKLDVACEKDRNRLASFTHEAAAQLAGFCERNGVGEVYYLDRDQGFMDFRESKEPMRFPWHELRSKLEQKLTERGIALYSESGERVSAPASPESPRSDGAIDGNALEGHQWLRTDRLREAATLKVSRAMSRRDSANAATAR
jgi:hypothetical protein